VSIWAAAIRERLRNSHKLKLAGRLVGRVLSPVIPLYRRMLLRRTLERMEALRIHLGCGKIADPRFLNVDARPFPHVHYVTASPLMPALPEGRADMIYACHVFEHLSYHTQARVLKRWYALLKPGGELMLSVPDFEKAVALYQRGEWRFSTLQNVLMGGQDYRENYHRALFTADHLARLLARAGFTNVRHWHAKDQDAWPRDWSWAEHLSLNLYAQKP
jgi:predicted SAM-dependent methyltransferase